MMTKHWCFSFIIFFVMLLTGIGGLTVVIDPYFHFHKPLNAYAYRIYNERYQNDGIVKHFEYDGLITGTSMTQNFMTSEFDTLFDVSSIKVPFSGASYKEVSENLCRALEINSDLKTVVWGLDYNRFFDDFNATGYDSYPVYLYDYALFNDVNYVFNKSVLFGDTLLNVLEYTKQGEYTTTFDEYNNWNSLYTFGSEAVLSQITRPEKSNTLSYSEFNSENITENVLSLVKSYPETDFYLFWTPYSIVFFDIENQNGLLKNLLKWEKEALELMLVYDNVHFFSFFDEFNLITDLDNYKDSLHYSEDVNSYILQCMSNGEHEITIDNYEEYCKKEWDFYSTYDYDSIWK